MFSIFSFYPLRLFKVKKKITNWSFKINSVKKCKKKKKKTKKVGSDLFIMGGWWKFLGLDVRVI